MRRNRLRVLFALTTVMSILWFRNNPAIRFKTADGAAPTGTMSLSELTANVLVASIVAILAVVAITSIGRAMGWWKDE